MKLDASPAPQTRAKWLGRIRTAQAKVKRILKDSPSLEQTVAGTIKEEAPDAGQEVLESLAEHGETPRIAVCPDYAPHEVVPSLPPLPTEEPPGD